MTLVAPDPVRRRAGLSAYWVAVAATVAVWLLSLSLTSVRNLGQWGLITAVSPLWYLAALAALGLVLVNLLSARPSMLRFAVALGVLILILSATPAIVEAVPRLPWVYKHIAVTRYINLHDSVNRNIDIYNRWPGFFILAAIGGRLTGLQDPTAYAAWAEPFFALLWTYLVFRLGGLISGSARIGAFAATLFAIMNWVGQNYFSPQAFAFTLYLVLLIIVFSYLQREPFRVGKALDRLVLSAVSVGLRTRPAVNDDLTTAGAAGRRRSASSAVTWRILLAIVLIQAVITVSHQLTPYMVAFGVVPLFALGYLRPWWIGFLIILIPVLYLIPNYSYVQDHFGISTGFDPVSNATYTAPQSVKLHAENLQALGTRVLTLIAYLAAAVGLVRRARAGHIRVAIITAWMAAAPAVTLIGQSYGGEGRLRVVLFGLPWLAIAGAWAFAPINAERLGFLGRRVPGEDAADPQRLAQGSWIRLAAPGLAAAALIAVATVVYVPTSLQVETDDQVSAADVAASKWLDSNVRFDDVVMPTAPVFPTLIGPHYNRIVNTNGVLPATGGQQVNLTVTSVRNAARLLSAPDSKNAFIIFSRQQQRYADEHKLFAPGQLADLANTLAQSPLARAVYQKSGTTIYELEIR